MKISLEKKHTLFFVGEGRPDEPAYSHGVRQTLFALFKNNTPGMHIAPLKVQDMLLTVDIQRATLHVRDAHSRCVSLDMFALQASRL